MTRLLRIRDVMHMTGLSRSTIYRKMQEDSFPTIARDAMGLLWTKKAPPYEGRANALGGERNNQGFCVSLSIMPFLNALPDEDPK